MTQTHAVSSVVFSVPDHKLRVPANQATWSTNQVGTKYPRLIPVRLHVPTQIRPGCFATGCAVK